MDTSKIGIALCRGGCGLRLDASVDWPCGPICYRCLAKERGEMLEMLKAMEWCGFDGRAPLCPSCDGYKPNHLDPCELAILLKRPSCQAE